MAFHGISNGMGDLTLLSNAKSRSLCAENPRGEVGRGGSCPLEEGVARQAARDLGLGWKVNPYRMIRAGEIAEIADIAGPGCIHHIWCTPTGKWRNLILRVYWGRTGIPVRRMPGGRLFRDGLEQVRTDFFACSMRQPRKRVQLLLAHALPQALPHDY